MVLEAIIFDSDGTIFDSGIIKKVYNDMKEFFSEKYKSQFGEDSYEYIFSRSMVEKDINDTGVSWEDTCKGLGILETDYKFTGDIFLLFQELYFNEIKPFEGIKKVLDYCRFESNKNTGKDIKCYILSTNNVEHVKRLLKRFELSSYFDWPESILPTKNLKFPDKNERKPNPAPINRLIKEMGYNKEDIVYVGDMLVDALTCQNAGIKMIHAGWGKNTRYTILNGVDEEFVDKITFLESTKDLYFRIKMIHEGG